MAVKYSARRVRALFAEVTKLDDPPKGSNHTFAGASASSVGACIVTRPGRNTIVICQQTTASQCVEIDTQLSIEGAGHAAFYAGQKCKS